LLYLDLTGEYLGEFRSDELSKQVKRLATFVRSGFPPLSTVEAKLRNLDVAYWNAYQDRDASFFRKLYPDVPIIPLQFLCERLQGACSLFDDPLVRRKLKEEIPEVYENMVKLGVITSERKE
jgi:hypothetical protein